MTKLVLNTQVRKTQDHDVGGGRDAGDDKVMVVSEADLAKLTLLPNGDVLFNGVKVELDPAVQTALQKKADGVAVGTPVSTPPAAVQSDTVDHEPLKGRVGARVPVAYATEAEALQSRIELTKSKNAEGTVRLSTDAFAGSVRDLAQTRWSEQGVSATLRDLEKAYPPGTQLSEQDGKQLVKLRDMLRESAPWSIGDAMGRAKPLADFFRDRGIPWSPADDAKIVSKTGLSVDLDEIRKTLKELTDPKTGAVVLTKQQGRALANKLKNLADDHQITRLKRELAGVKLEGEGASRLQSVLDNKTSYRLDRLEIVDAVRQAQRNGFTAADRKHLREVLDKYKSDHETLAFARRFIDRAIGRAEEAAPASAAAARSEFTGFFAKCLPEGTWTQYDAMLALRRNRPKDPWDYYCARAAIVGSKTRTEFELALQRINIETAATIAANMLETMKEDAEQAARQYKEAREVELVEERRTQERDLSERRDHASRDEEKRQQGDVFRGRQRAARHEVTQQPTAAGRDDAQARVASAQAAEADTNDRRLRN